MRKRDFGLLPASSHATRSSRVSTGVMSTSSRAMRDSEGQRGATIHAPAAQGQSRAGVRPARPGTDSNGGEASPDAAKLRLRRSSAPFCPLLGQADGAAGKAGGGEIAGVAHFIKA